ncbi:MAG: hypothetical protein KatS3mg077_1552 [Candidatus Binatia bacterium]|nr:MAG: hypothetical protein KatS3mg077_1542 [Candidatus Binatia bacterium]GIW44270.1 MAG: hypothetical protein KatS3mg077_1552 [Candidatus Binatia bacterium]
MLQRASSLQGLVADGGGVWVYWDIRSVGECAIEGRFALLGDPAFRMGTLALNASPNGLISGVLRDTGSKAVGRFRGRAGRLGIRGYLYLPEAASRRKLAWRLPAGRSGISLTRSWFGSCWAGVAKGGERP